MAPDSGRPHIYRQEFTGWGKTVSKDMQLLRACESSSFPLLLPVLMLLLSVLMLILLLPVLMRILLQVGQAHQIPYSLIDVEGFFLLMY